MCSLSLLFLGSLQLRASRSPFYLCLPPHSGHHPLWFCIYCLSEARSIRGRWHTQQSPTLSLLLSSALSFSASGIRTWRMFSERHLEKQIPWINNLGLLLHDWIFLDVSKGFTLWYLRSLYHLPFSRGWHMEIKWLSLGSKHLLISLRKLSISFHSASSTSTVLNSTFTSTISSLLLL